MADGIEFKLDLPDFKRQMAAFSVEFEQKTVRSATAAAGRVFKDLVLAKVPVLRPLAGKEGPRNRTSSRIAGTLKRSIYMALSKDSTPGRVHYVISFRKKRRDADPYYGTFLERGWIPRGPGNQLRGGYRFKTLHRARNVRHKITKYAFILPAFTEGKAAALEAFNVRMTRLIKRQNKKQRIK